MYYKKIFRLRIVVTVATSILALLISATVKAQDNPIPVQCGTILVNEFTPTILESDYEVSLAAGDQISVEIDPLGDGVEIIAELFDTLGNSLNRPAASQPATPPVLRKVGATGIYRINVKQYIGTGMFTLKIGCILNDNTIINPGDLPFDQAFPTNPPAPPIFSGIGFPGLSPVDFSNIPKIPMIAGAPMAGAVASSETLGFTFDANAGDTVDLTFTRLSGNLNLGLVVLSADNKVAFQASLVTSSALNTRFTLPSAGTYTIGVFRIDLLPPAAPEPTAFQVQAVLNP